MRFQVRYGWLCTLALAGFSVLAAHAQSSEHPRLVAQVSSGEVLACAYSPDGRTVLTGGREGVARLWDVSTGVELRTFQGEAWINHVAFTSDNRSVITVSTLDELTAVQLWDLATGSELARFSPPVGKLIFGMASPDGKAVATASPFTSDKRGSPLQPEGGARIQLWNVDTGKETREFLIKGADAASVYSVLSPDGTSLFTGDFDGPRLWDLPSGKLLHRFENKSEVVSTASFSADGRRVVWGTIQGTVRLADLESGKMVQHFSGMKSGQFMGSLESAVLSPDGRRVLTASGDNTARVWDVEAGKQLQRFQYLAGSTVEGMKCAAFSPDGRLAVTGSSDQTAHLWDVETGKEVRFLTEVFADEVAAQVFVSSGHGIVTVSRTGMVWEWDAETGQAIPRPLQASNGEIPPAATPVDDGPIACCVGKYVSTVVISADGRRVFLSPFRGEQGVWDVQTGKMIRNFPMTAGQGFEAADLSPDGTHLLTSNGGFSATLWYVPTATEIQHFNIPHHHPETNYRAAVVHVALSPNGGSAQTSDSEGTIRLWDVKSGKEVRSLKLNGYETQSIGFSPDGIKMLAENPDKSAELRDVRSGKTLTHFGRSSRSSFSADGRRLLMGNSVWDVESGKEFRHFVEPIGSELLGKLSPDGHKVLLAGRDGTTKLWDIETGKELATLYCFRNDGWAVVDPEGRFDTGNILSNIAMHWVLDRDTVRVLPLAAFRERYYTPRLLAHILNGEKLPTVQ